MYINWTDRLTALEIDRADQRKILHGSVDGQVSIYLQVERLRYLGDVGSELRAEDALLAEEQVVGGRLVVVLLQIEQDPDIIAA